MNEKFALNEQTILRKEKFGALVIIKATIEVYIFNKLSYEILEIIKKKPCGLHEIADQLYKKYKVDMDVLVRDIQCFLQNVLDRNIITRSV